tara:strand:- start:10739 stop:12631 length:1893 start_codon:yes stop_codon:yes gene_type:complete
MDLGGSVEQMELLNLVSGGELTISSGAITVTHSVHTVDTESDAVTDDLATISGGSAGDVILLSRANAARAVVLKHNVGNIKTPSGTDHELTALGFVVLKHDGSNWQLQCGNGSGYMLNKLACLTVATSNITLNDTQVINGVNCPENSRVLLTAQDDPTENGPMIVKGEDPYYPSSGDWIRPDDFKNGFSVSGHMFYIEQGTEYSDSVWMLTNGCGEDIVGTNELNLVNLVSTETEFDISILTAESSNSDSDLIAIYDASATAMRKQTRGEFLAGITGGDGVPGTRTISAGDGLTGGGDLSADRTLSLDISGLTAESTAGDTDLIAIYDASASALRKQTRAQFLAGIGGGVSESRTITAGVGLTGGGDLSADRTLSLDIVGLTAESTAGNSDLLVIYDTSAAAYRKQTRSEFLAGVTTGLVTTGTSVNTGSGLTGGGNLTTSRTLSLDFVGLTAETTPGNSDLIAIYDASASAYRKQTRANFLSGAILADGSIPMSGQLVYSFPGGSIEVANIAAPQIVKQGYEDSGFFFGDGDKCGISLQGAKVFQFDTTGIECYLPYRCYDDFRVEGHSRIQGLGMFALSADPDPAPVDGEMQIWLSDGTESGDAGDVMLKIRIGTTTKTITLVDFSAS